MKLFCVCVCWFGVCVSLVCVWDCVFCTLTGHQRMACVNKSLASCHATLKQFPLWTTLPSLSLWFSLSLSYTQTHSRVCVCVYPPILKNKCDNVTWISFIKPSLCEQVCWCRVLVRPHLKTWASTLDDEKKKATAQKTAVICPSWGESARTKSSLRTPSQLKHGATRLWRPSLLHPSLPHLL